MRRFLNIFYDFLPWLKRFWRSNSRRAKVENKAYLEWLSFVELQRVRAQLQLDKENHVVALLESIRVKAARQADDPFYAPLLGLWPCCRRSASWRWGRWRVYRLKKVRYTSYAIERGSLVAIMVHYLHVYCTKPSMSVPVPSDQIIIIVQCLLSTHWFKWLMHNIKRNDNEKSVLVYIFTSQPR